MCIGEIRESWDDMIVLEGVCERPRGLISSPQILQLLHTEHRRRLDSLFPIFT